VKIKSQLVSFRNIEENRRQDDLHQTLILHGSQGQSMEETGSDKETRARRLLQIKLGITPEGMV
jgi:hypothetical protein